MGLMNKLKNILFEEEEVEIPVIEKKEKPVVVPPQVQQPVYKEMPRKEEPPKEVASIDYSGFLESLEDSTPQNVQVPRRVETQQYSTSSYSDREMFQSEKTFNFPAFDEEEFEQMAPRPRETNVMEYERKKQEKKQEVREEKKVEIKKVDSPKFRPSPIISPVYGILDKNYTPDEITTRRDLGIARALDVDSVRKKAFGSIEETPKIEEKREEVINDNDDDRILEERLEKARTIDELLSDSSDDIITLDDLEEDILPKDDDIEQKGLTYNNVEPIKEIEPKKQEVVEEDTLESDLFDLIDSMYENREDGE